MESQAEGRRQELGSPLKTYQVVVAVPDMKPFDIAEADNLSETYLYARKHKKKSVWWRSRSFAPGRPRIQNVIFSFRRNRVRANPNGADEKGADFFTACRHQD